MVNDYYSTIINNKVVITHSAQVSCYLNPLCPMLGARKDCHGLNPASNSVLAAACSVPFLNPWLDGEEMKNIKPAYCAKRSLITKVQHK